MANVTPLSLTHPLPPLKRKGRAFEESIKETNLRTEEPRSPNFAPFPKREQILPKSTKISEESCPGSGDSSTPSLSHRRKYKGDVSEKLAASIDSLPTHSALCSRPDNAYSGSSNGPCSLVSTDSNTASTKSLVELAGISKK